MGIEKDVIGRDQINLVTIRRITGSYSNALAVNYRWFLANGKLLSTDIVFNTKYKWATNGAKNAYDVQSVAAHEFGHSLCLKDLYRASDKGETMYGRGDKGETGARTLGPGDKRGIQFLY